MTPSLGHRPPRGRLAALTLAVMVAHALVLNGGLPNWRFGLRGEDPAAMDPARDTTSSTSATDDSAADAADLPVPPPVTRSSVRWIQLAPPPPPPPLPPPPPPPPVPQPVPPPPPPLPPEPLPEAVPMPRPEPAPDVELPATDDTAETEPAPPEIAPVPEQAALAPAEPTAPLPVGGPAPGEADARLPPARLPPEIDLRYTVTGQAKGFNYYASGAMTLRHDHQRYEAHASVSAFLLGKRQQHSEGRIDEQGMHPEVFVDQSRRERRAILDAASQRIRFHHGGEAPLQAGTQDRLSVALQLSALFLARPDAYPTGSTIRLPVADASNVELWDFVVQGPDELHLENGSLPAIRLARQPRRERDRQVEVWLAPAMSYLPARIRISEASGDFVDQTIDALPSPAQ